jgi:hypothetical protein
MRACRYLKRGGRRQGRGKPKGYMYSISADVATGARANVTPHGNDKGKEDLDVLGQEMIAKVAMSTSEAMQQLLSPLSSSDHHRQRQRHQQQRHGSAHIAGGIDSRTLPIKLEKVRRNLQSQSYGNQGQDPARLFRHWDRKKTGALTAAEFGNMIRKAGFCSKAEVSDAELGLMFRAADTDQNARISTTELTEFVWGSTDM